MLHVVPKPVQKHPNRIIPKALDPARSHGSRKPWPQARDNNRDEEERARHGVQAEEDVSFNPLVPLSPWRGSSKL